jgi:hypothetical protein
MGVWAVVMRPCKGQKGLRTNEKRCLMEGIKLKKCLALMNIRQIVTLVGVQLLRVKGSL